MRQWTGAEGQTILDWFEQKAPAWLKGHRAHNLSVLPHFYELHSNIPVTFETLEIAIKSADLLPDRYNPGAKNRLKIGEPPQSEPQSPAQVLADALAKRPEQEAESKPPRVTDAGVRTYLTSEHRLEEVGIGSSSPNLPYNNLLGLPTPDAAERAKAKEALKKAHEDRLEEGRKAREAFEQAEAKRECDSMCIASPSGFMDHGFIELLKKIAWRRPDGSIDFRATLLERKKYLAAYEWRKEHNLPTTPGFEKR